VWLVTGVLTVTAALTYGGVSMMPHAGGAVRVSEKAYNPLIRFCMAGRTGDRRTIAAIAAFAKFTGIFLGRGIKHMVFLAHMKFSTVHWSPWIYSHSHPINTGFSSERKFSPPRKF
jgi:hypothetical protein